MKLEVSMSIFICVYSNEKNSIQHAVIIHNNWLLFHKINHKFKNYVKFITYNKPN